jgi:hypothetical protein
MSMSISRVQYFYTTVKDKPGEAYNFLERLCAAGVNLLAFNAIPMGPELTQLVVYPEHTDVFRNAVRIAGFALTGPHDAFLIQGDDQLGAFAEIHRKLYEENINVSASGGVTDGRGGYGYTIWVRPDDFDKAARALGV